MKILHVAQRYRSGTMGLFFAGLGFTYALATSGGANTLTYNASSRAIGTTCPRPPTQFVTASDLGFVVVATNYRRQILVRFGIGPHTFLLNTDPQAQKIPVTLTSDGAVVGTPSKSGRFDFSVTVQDSSTEKPIPQITRGFFITALDATTAPTPLSIVNGPILPTGVTGASYGYTIQANGGISPYTYTFADDASHDALPAGLALREDGQIFGAPVFAPANASSFTIIATDLVGNSAQKTFTLPVVQGSISTDVIASTGRFKFSFGRDGTHDTIKMSLILNKDDLGAKNIRTKADLKGIPVGILIGGVVLPPGVQLFTSTDTNTATSTDTSTSTSTSTSTTTPLNIFDAKGTVSFPLPLTQGGTLPRAKNQPTYKIALDPKTGILNFTFTGVSLIKGLGGDFRNFRNVIPVEVVLGAATGTAGNSITGTSTGTGVTTGVALVTYDKVSLVQFDYRRSSTVGSGTTNKRDISNPGGQFLITKVTGTEVKGSGDFDVITMQLSGFLRLPGGKPLSPVATDVVSIVVGGTKNSCIGSFPASSLETKGNILTFTNTDATVPLRTLTIDNRKGTILITTNTVDAFRIFNEDSLLSGEPHKLPVLLTFSSPDGTSVSLDAVSSVVVYRKGVKLQNR